MKKIIEKHENIAFMFSGGKDSLACLFLLKPFLDKINVIWVNTGDTFPETRKIIKDFVSELPKFIEVKTDVNSFKKKFGLPTDLVPIKNTHAGKMAVIKSDIKLVNGYECCLNNLWVPAMKAANDIGATLIIRGQRNDEPAKTPIKSGHVENGVEYLFPIEDWTQEKVLEFLKENNFDPPEFFNFAESSLDCISCTAFLDGINDRKQYMIKNHPEKHSENIINLKKIISAAEKELDYMKEYATYVQ